jgi:hypothetical protein
MVINLPIFHDNIIQSQMRIRLLNHLMIQLLIGLLLRLWRHNVLSLIRKNVRVRELAWGLRLLLVLRLLV